MAVKRKIDFTNAGDGFKLLPEDTYVVNVFDIVDKPSKAGDPGVNVTLKVAEGEYKGQSVFYYLLEKETTLWRVREFLEACGATIPKKAVMVDYDKCLGKKLEIEVKHREFNGRQMAEVVEIRKYEAAAGDEDVPGGDEEEEIPF
jgi:hypothetical protein